MGFFLVTGGCGFIGSHLVDALSRRGHRVRVLDDLSVGKRENVPQAEIVVGDIVNADVVREAIEGASTAASTSPRSPPSSVRCSTGAAPTE